MRRWLTVLLLALTLGQTAGVVVIARVDECEQDCPGEGRDGDCPPACEFCSCCPTVRPVVLVPVSTLLPPAPAAWMGEQALAARPAPDPREILHVPEHFA